MTFIWVLGSGSKYGNAEIRYSMRSVAKYHPKARLVIVGEKPKWYTGEHHYVPDASDCAYVNQWNKLQYACTLAEEFVYMDDDFYLLRPFEPFFYTRGPLVDKYKKVQPISGGWRDVVVNTYRTLGDVPSYLQHAPLPIKSSEFLEIAERYPGRLTAPSLVPRQVYCLHSTYCETRNKKDIKIRGRFKPKQIEGLPFFSIADRFERQADLLRAMYPDAIKSEIPKRLGRAIKQKQTDIQNETES